MDFITLVCVGSLVISAIGFLAVALPALGLVGLVLGGKVIDAVKKSE